MSRSRLADIYISRNGIPVYKLHGSVNWYEIEGDLKKFSVEDRVVNYYSDYDIKNPSSLPYIYHHSYVSSIPPVIIPPSFLKPDFTGPLSAIWQGAAEKLKTANILIFVGYSFPLTDTDMLYFLARSLTDNAGLRTILIIDPLANKLLQKLSLPENKIGSHFKTLLKIDGNKWEDVRLQQYLQ